MHQLYTLAHPPVFEAHRPYSPAIVGMPVHVPISQVLLACDIISFSSALQCPLHAECDSSDVLLS